MMRSAGTAALVIFAFGALSAQEPSCKEIAAMAQTARSKSAATLASWKVQAGDGYRAKVVFAFRSFELRPADIRSATAVLDLIPRTEEEDSVCHTFGDLLCGSEAKEDMVALAELGARLPSDLARAVLLLPDRMRQYVAYARVSVQDPDSDYAVQMRRVCRTRKQQFTRAVNNLRQDEKSWFVQNIFNPDGCRVLALPEAE